jgi:hypothetical protein
MKFGSSFRFCSNIDVSQRDSKWQYYSVDRPECVRPFGCHDAGVAAGPWLWTRIAEGRMVLVRQHLAADAEGGINNASGLRRVTTGMNHG